MKLKIKIEFPVENEDFVFNVAPGIYPRTKDYLDSVWGDITRHNIKIMADGRQYVVDCLTGEVLERESADPVRDSKGNIMWIKKGCKLSALDRPNVYQWKNPQKVAI